MPKFITRTAGQLLISHKRHERGFALVSVLWLVALMGVLALGILSIARTDSLTAHTDLEEAQAESWADAGVFLAVHELSNMKTAKDVPVDGSPRIFNIDGHEIEISVQDENGKIDLNYAPKELLTSLFLIAGLSADQSANIADAIQAKRSVFSAGVSSGGAQTASQALQTLPFVTIEQLKSIHGVTGDLFIRIRPALTVYSQQSIVQASTAPREVLQVLPGMAAENVEKVMAERQSHPVTAGGIGIIESMTGQGAALGRSFTLIAKARVGKGVFCRRAVILITGIPKHPYAIMEWSRGGV